eukprot:COSAG01_NODE_10832_length_2072_cov_1.223517_2_plen_169_part_00
MKHTLGQPLLSLAVSDRNKRLLLDNEDFVPHLLDGLLMDPHHPQSLPASATDWEAVKAPVQRDYAECLQQLSLHEPCRLAMAQNCSVVAELRELAANAWTPEARLCAHGALLTLVDKHHGGGDGGGTPKNRGGQQQKGGGWIMMSYECGRWRALFFILHIDCQFLAGD